ncbi:MAG: 50S ribosomal protein L25 [Chloroflexaceae bacterium]
METKHMLDMQLREVVGKKVKRLRRQGLLPATVYGKGIGPFTVQLDERNFTKMYRDIGRTTLVELNIPGQPRQSAFVHDIQRHPVSRDILHADFYVVNLRERMTVEVPLALTGTSPVAERGDGVVNQVRSTVEVEALPSDMPSYINVDLSLLTTMDKMIHVGDLAGAVEYTITTDPEDLVVSLTPTRAARTGAEEAEEAEEEVPTGEPTLIREERPSHQDEQE